MDTDLTPGDRPEAAGGAYDHPTDGSPETGADPKEPSANDDEALSRGQEPRCEVQIFTSDNHLRSLAEIEADIIRLAIGHYRGQMSEAARRLGIGRSTLYRKLSELKIDPPAAG